MLFVLNFVLLTYECRRKRGHVSLQSGNDAEDGVEKKRLYTKCHDSDDALKMPRVDLVLSVAHWTEIRRRTPGACERYIDLCVRVRSGLHRVVTNTSSGFVCCAFKLDRMRVPTTSKQRAAETYQVPLVSSSKKPRTAALWYCTK